jgi:hypothetical protein
MTHWEFSHIPFDGDLTDDEIVCQKCGWHWKVKDGGDDLYVCHKCFTDNSKYYQFSNFDTIGAVAGAVGSVAGAVGSVAQAKASKQLSKSDKQKEIETICGKDKSKSWSKKKKLSFNQCKLSVLSDLDNEKNLSKEEKQKQLEFQQNYLLEQNKQKRTQTYIIIGIIAVILGFAIYKKMNK